MVVTVVVRVQKSAAVVVMPILPSRQEKKNPHQVNKDPTKGQGDVQPPRRYLGWVYQPWDGVEDYLQEGGGGAGGEGDGNVTSRGKCPWSHA